MSLPHPPVHRQARGPSHSPVRPHAAWYVVPGLMQAATLVCALLAATTWARASLERAGGGLLTKLRDVTTYGDGNPAPPNSSSHSWGGPPESVSLLLHCAAASGVLSVVVFIAISMARARSRRGLKQVRFSPAPPSGDA